MKSLPKDNAYCRLPIHIITGFLGSGKTTLLNHLLKQSKMEDTAVIVNEWGEIGIDHLLLESKTEDIMMLAGGCLCCAVRGDLVMTLENLFKRREKREIPLFRRVLIETTGLADPAPILRTLLNDPFVALYYRLDLVITTVDAVYGMQQLGEYDESVKQAALADHLILTKTDLVDAKDIENLRQHLLSQLNPTASFYQGYNDYLSAVNLVDPVYYRHDHQFDVRRWLKTDVYQHPFLPKVQRKDDAERHDAYIRTFCINYPEPLSWRILEHWIRQLTRLRGKDLLRVKGIAYTQETALPVVIQGVQHIFQPPVTLAAWPSEQRDSQIVFITRNIEKTMVEKNLYLLIRSQTPADVCAAAMILLNENADNL